MRQSDPHQRIWMAVLLTLAAMAGMSGKATASTALISDDFESYPVGEELHAKGGWISSGGSGQSSGVTVVKGSSTSGRNANAQVVRYHDDSGTDPNPLLRQSFPEESNYVVEATFLVRFNKLDGDVGMHNFVLRGTGGAASRLRFGPDGLILLGSRDEPGGSRKRGHRIITQLVPGDWYRVTLAADPQTQMTWATATNLDRDEPGQQGETQPVPFYSNVSSLSRWSVERASMTPVDISLDDVEVRLVPDPDRDVPVDLSGLEMPGEPEVSKGARVRMIDGRLDDEEAVAIEAGTIAWKTPTLEGHHYAEFWFNPLHWNPVLGDNVVIATFQVGDEQFVLRKPADRSELRLERDGQVLQVYPTYAWDNHNWQEGSSGRGIRGLIRRSIPWHHVHLAITGGRLALTVDGFPARRVETAEATGSLARLELHGEPGTAFAAVAVEAGTPMEAGELRDRYVTLFLNEPRIMRNLITVPYLSQPPSIDGQVDEAEWANAARIIGFSKLGDGATLAENVAGYIGYDDERVYLAVVTPTDAPINRNHGSQQQDQPLWEQEAVVMTLSPPFVSGEDPRRAAQLVGSPTGNQTELMVLPTRDLDWSATWDWRATTGSRAWQGELAAAFEDLDFPIPGPTDMWGLNIVNPGAGATWSYVETDPNLGNIRFQRGAPAIRPIGLTFNEEGSAELELEIVGGENEQNLIVGMQLFGSRDRLPRQTVDETLAVEPGQPQRVRLTLDLDGQEAGRVALFVREGHLFLYYHSVKFPAAEGR